MLRKRSCWTGWMKWTERKNKPWSADSPALHDRLPRDSVDCWGWLLQRHWVIAVTGSALPAFLPFSLILGAMRNSLWLVKKVYFHHLMVGILRCNLRMIEWMKEWSGILVWLQSHVWFRFRKHIFRLTPPFCLEWIRAVLVQEFWRECERTS